LTSTSFHLLAGGRGLEPGTTGWAYHLIEADSPDLGWLNDSSALRTDSIERCHNFFEIDFLLVGHAGDCLTWAKAGRCCSCLRGDSRRPAFAGGRAAPGLPCHRIAREPRCAFFLAQLQRTGNCLTAGACPVVVAPARERFSTGRTIPLTTAIATGPHPSDRPCPQGLERRDSAHHSSGRTSPHTQNPCSGHFEVAVGTTIADRPPHRSARALISACGSYRG
jgi:hypothetical protein